MPLPSFSVIRKSGLYTASADASSVGTNGILQSYSSLEPLLTATSCIPKMESRINNSTIHNKCRNIFIKWLNVKRLYTLSLILQLYIIYNNTSLLHAASSSSWQFSNHNNPLLMSSSLLSNRLSPGLSSVSPSTNFFFPVRSLLPRLPKLNRRADNARPETQDTEPPVFLNCPTKPSAMPPRRSLQSNGIPKNSYVKNPSVPLISYDSNNGYVYTNEAGKNGRHVYYNVPTSIDSYEQTRIDGVVVNELRYGPGQFFGIGSHKVVVVVKDKAGNANQCVFFITVKDVESPMFTKCPVNRSLLAEVGEKQIKIDYDIPAAVDNSKAPVQLKRLKGSASGDYVSLYSNNGGGGIARGGSIRHTVVYEALDNSRNRSVCQFTFTITKRKLPQSINTGPISSLNMNADSQEGGGERASGGGGIRNILGRRNGADRANGRQKGEREGLGVGNGGLKLGNGNGGNIGDGLKIGGGRNAELMGAGINAFASLFGISLPSSSAIGDERAGNGGNNIVGSRVGGSGEMQDRLNLALDGITNGYGEARMANAMGVNAGPIGVAANGGWNLVNPSIINRGYGRRLQHINEMHNRNYYNSVPYNILNPHISFDNNYQTQAPPYPQSTPVNGSGIQGGGVGASIAAGGGRDWTKAASWVSPYITPWVDMFLDILPQPDETESGNFSIKNNIDNREVMSDGNGLTVSNGNSDVYNGIAARESATDKTTINNVDDDISNNKLIASASALLETAKTSWNKKNRSSDITSKDAYNGNKTKGNEEHLFGLSSASPANISTASGTIDSLSASTSVDNYADYLYALQSYRDQYNEKRGHTSNSGNADLHEEYISNRIDSTGDDININTEDDSKPNTDEDIYKMMNITDPSKSIEKAESETNGSIGVGLGTRSNKLAKIVSDMKRGTLGTEEDLDGNTNEDIGRKWEMPEQAMIVNVGGPAEKAEKDSTESGGENTEEIEEVMNNKSADLNSRGNRRRAKDNKSSNNNMKIIPIGIGPNNKLLLNNNKNISNDNDAGNGEEIPDEDNKNTEGTTNTTNGSGDDIGSASLPPSLVASLAALQASLAAGSSAFSSPRTPLASLPSARSDSASQPSSIPRASATPPIYDDHDDISPLVKRAKPLLETAKNRRTDNISNNNTPHNKYIETAFNPESVSLPPHDFARTAEALVFPSTGLAKSSRGAHNFSEVKPPPPPSRYRIPFSEPYRGIESVDGDAGMGEAINIWKEAAIDESLKHVIPLVKGVVGAVRSFRGDGTQNDGRGVEQPKAMKA